MTTEQNKTPSEDRILSEFLRLQFEEGMALHAESDILHLTPNNGPKSDRYVAEYACRGLVKDEHGEIKEFNHFVAGIWFPNDYLRRTDLSMIVSYLGPSPRPFHPNIRPPFICTHITPNTRLVDILYNCYELFTWRIKNTSDEGLNPEASQWARHQDPSRFPLDRRPLRRRKHKLNVTPTNPEAQR